MAEIVKLAVELLPEIFAGVTGAGAPPHAVNEISHDRTIIKAAQFKKTARCACFFGAEQGKRYDIYTPLPKGVSRGHSTAESRGWNLSSL